MISLYKNIEPKTKFCLFCFAYFLASAAEGFFTSLPLFLKEIHGNEFDAGIILFIAAISAIFIIWLIQQNIITLNPMMLATLGCLFCISALLPLIFTNQVDWFIRSIGIFIGISAGLAVISGSLFIARISLNHQLNFRFSIIAGLGLLGYMIAPLLMWHLHHFNFNYQQTLNIAVIFATSAGIIFLLLNKLQDIPSIIEQQNKQVNTTPKMKIKIIFLFITSFFTISLFGSLINFQSSYAIVNHLNYQAFFSCYLLSILLARLILAKFISIKYLEITLIISFIMSLLAFTIMTSLTVSYPVYLLFANLVGLSYGLTLPLLQTSLIIGLNDQQQKYYLSHFCNIYFLAAFGFPLISGWIITQFDYQYYFLFQSTLCFIGIFTAVINYLMTSYTNNTTKFQEVLYE